MHTYTYAMRAPNITSLLGLNVHRKRAPPTLTIYRSEVKRVTRAAVCCRPSSGLDVSSLTVARSVTGPIMSSRDLAS